MMDMEWSDEKRAANKRHRDKLRGSPPRVPRVWAPGEAMRWTRYKLTEVDYQVILAVQDGKCAICIEPMSPPHVDHCHETGKVRGLLCNDCNVGLGRFKDSVQRVASALAYLRDSG